MKSTIRAGGRAIIVQPSPTVLGSVMVLAFPYPSDPGAMRGELGISLTLTPEESGALIFALEQAAEAAQMAQSRVAA
jgi:hypothetical protein